MIDWSKLKTYKGNKYRSFEELCFQIAKGIYGQKGKITPIDDSGGGDGVEFYLTLPNGDQWGWQAKFYFPNLGLNASNRKRSIVGSLSKACQEHPQLKKWILCTPSNLTTKERNWFETTLCKSIPEDMSVELEHWGDSDFNNRLSEPRFAGKRNYFFGELELDMNWFEKQFGKQKASLAEKFRSSLHTESIVDACIHALLGDEKFVCQIAKWIEKINEALPELNNAICKLKGPTQKGIQWTEEAKRKVIESTESLQTNLVGTVSQLETAKKFLNEKRLSKAQAIDWESVLSQLGEALKTHRTVGDEHGTSKIRYTGKEEDEFRSMNEATSTVEYPGSLIANLLDDFLHFAIKDCTRINHSELNILGDAGVGKTHIACYICDERLNTGLPALFIRGIRFTSDQSIEEQLRSILDIPPSYSWNDFLQALSAAAEAYHTRIPLVIDGLNESTHNGAFSNVWRSQLKGLVQEIAKMKNLVLITTCRTSYKRAIWEDNDPTNMVCPNGFNSAEVKHAIEKYFNEYKIVADPTTAPLAHFEHPIYLKIFCETKNPTPATEKTIFLGEQSLFEVFEEYLAKCNRAVCDSLDRDPSTPLVDTALNKMAGYLWQNHSRYIPFEELVEMIDGQPLEDLVLSRSKTHAMESEGLLVCRDLGEVGKIVYFTYDLLGGYLIARYLVQQTSDDLRSFLNCEETVTALFSGDYETLHPMQDDISRCLAVLLPAEIGQFLHNLSDNKTATDLSICALFEISPEYINEDCINLITRLFETHQNREPLLELAQNTVGNANHPFNASFWSDRLLELPMTERDLSWTEHVRQNTERFGTILERFETSCKSDQQLSDISMRRLNLLAEYIMWLLTSTVRSLRDKATRALYWYGRRYPKQFFDLVLNSLSINDPYVPERMLAATYGIAMARQHDFDDASFAKEMLRLYGSQLFESMFKPGAPHSTTHILARDYARRTIDIALIQHSDLLTDDERKRITPPFTDGGIRKWGESEDKAVADFQRSLGPMRMDFANYTLGHLVKDRHNYDFEHSEYKRVLSNILWRIYDLGYSLDRFEEIDAWINQGNQIYGRSKNGGKTERYGKKYSWIAFFELAGLRGDKMLLPDYFDDARISEADIDPSFPADPQEYNLVTRDLLGNRKVPYKEWVSKNFVPDLIPYLKANQLCGEEGTWILLQGNLHQEDNQARREILAFLQGLIVKSEDSEEIAEGLKQDKIDTHSALFCPNDYLTYAGEIPWCETFPKNSWEDVSCELGTVSIPTQQSAFHHNGESLSDNERRESSSNIAGLIGTDGEQMIETQLRALSNEIRARIASAEQPEFKEFKVLAPIRENHWENSLSAIIAGRNIVVPSKQIAETFGLCGQPQSFNLFEKDGRCASLTFRYGQKLTDTQRFTYLREDLLKRYLENIDGELIWVIWGEQCLVSQDQNTSIKPFEELTEFEEVMAYRQLCNSL